MRRSKSICWVIIFTVLFSMVTPYLGLVRSDLARKVSAAGPDLKVTPDILDAYKETPVLLELMDVAGITLESDTRIDVELSDNNLDWIKVREEKIRIIEHENKKKIYLDAPAWGSEKSVSIRIRAYEKDELTGEEIPGSWFTFPNKLTYRASNVILKSITPSQFRIDRGDVGENFVLNLLNLRLPGGSEDNPVANVEMYFAYSYYDSENMVYKRLDKKLDGNSFEYYDEAGVKLDPGTDKGKSAYKITASTKCENPPFPSEFKNALVDFELHVTYGNGFKEVQTIKGIKFGEPQSKPKIEVVFDAQTGKNFGSLKGGNVVYIAGDDFRQSEGDKQIEVYFGDQKAQLAGPIQPGTEIYKYAGGYEGQGKKYLIPVLVPESTRTGKVEVLVINPDGASAVSFGPGEAGYEYKTSVIGENVFLSPTVVNKNSEEKLFVSNGNFLQNLLENDFPPKWTIDNSNGSYYEKLEEYLEENTVVKFIKDGSDIGVPAGIKLVKDENNNYLIRIDLEERDNEGHRINKFVEEPGMYKVVLENPYGSFELKQRFQVNDVIGVPENISFVPDPLEGSRTGGTEVIIKGGNLGSINKIEVGSKQASFQLETYEEEGRIKYRLKFITPPGDVGYAPIRFTLLDGRVLEDGSWRFNYLPEPEIKGVSPTQIVAGKENYLVINGNDFVYKNPNTNEEELLITGVELQEKKINGPKIISVTPDQIRYGQEKGNDYLLIRVDSALGDEGKRFELNLKYEVKAGIQKEKKWSGEIAVIPSAQGSAITLASINPMEASRLHETDAVITGTGFSKNDLRVFFFNPGGQEFAEARVEYVNTSGTFAKIKIPSFPLPSTPGAEQKVKLMVMNVARPGSALLMEEFTYRYPQSAPYIQDIVPKEGPKTGWIPITIYGSGFEVDKDGDGSLVKPSLYFIDDRSIVKAETAEIRVLLEDGNGNKREITVEEQGTIIEAKLPANTIGVKDVVVINPDLGLARLKGGFTYKEVADAPIIDEIRLPFGQWMGDDEVEIIGKNFKTGAKVIFGNEESSQVKVDNSNIIKAKVPRREDLSTSTEPVKVDVRVVNTDGSSGIKIDGFTYVPANIPNKPHLNDVNPILPGVGIVTGGTEVVVYGENFKPGLTLFIGGKEATNIEVYDGSGKLLKPEDGETGVLIRARTPAGLKGTTSVAVLNPDNGYDIRYNCFTYTDKISSPTIDEKTIVPTKSLVAGGGPIQFTGTGIQEGARLFIGGNEASEVRVSLKGDGKISVSAYIPAGTLGVKDLTILNPDGGSYTAKDVFEYVNPVTEIRINKIEPNYGRTDGKTLATAEGIFKFNSGEIKPGNWLVFIAGELAEVLPGYVTETGIKFNTPAISEPGFKDVYVVSKEDGNFAVLRNGFEFRDLGSPTITKVDPNKGLTKGGERVTITGTNFDQNIKVYIGGSAVQVESQSGSTTIIIRTPEKDIGTYDVKVENPDGTNYTLPNGFTYYGAPKGPGGFRVTPVGNDGTSLKVEWDPVAGADYYELFGRRRNDSDFQFLASVTDTYYYVKGLTPDTWYEFRVRAVNRHGVSSQSNSDWSYTSYRSWSNYIPPYNVSGSVNRQGDTAVYTMGAGEFAGSNQIVVDLSSYSDARVHSLYLPANLVTGFSWRQIILKTDLVHLKFSPRAVNGYEFMQSYPTHSDTQVKLSISKLSRGDEERLLKYLPRNMIQASPVLEIGGQVSSRHKDIKMTTFAQPLGIGLMGDPKLVGTNYTANFQAYYFNHERIAWEPLGNKTTWYRSLSESLTMRPGYYVLLAEKR